MTDEEIEQKLIFREMTQVEQYMARVSHVNISKFPAIFTISTPDTQNEVVSLAIIVARWNLHIEHQWRKQHYGLVCERKRDIRHHHTPCNETLPGRVRTKKGFVLRLVH